LEVLLGNDGRRKMRLRRRTNAELFQLYEGELSLRHRSREAKEEAQRLLGHFQKFLGQYPPSAELATKFLARFAHLKPATLYRYHSIINSLMQWYGDPLSSKIRLPERLPEYVELSISTS